MKETSKKGKKEGKIRWEDRKWKRFFENREKHKIYKKCQNKSCEKKGNTRKNEFEKRENKGT